MSIEMGARVSVVGTSMHRWGAGPWVTCPDLLSRAPAAATVRSIRFATHCNYGTYTAPGVGAGLGIWSTEIARQKLGRNAQGMAEAVVPTKDRSTAKRLPAASHQYRRLTTPGAWRPTPVFGGGTMRKILICSSLRSSGAPNSWNPGHTGVSPVSHWYLTGLRYVCPQRECCQILSAGGKLAVRLGG